MILFILGHCVSNQTFDVGPTHFVFTRKRNDISKNVGIIVSILVKVKLYKISAMTHGPYFQFLLRSNVQFHFHQCSSDSGRRLFWANKDCLCFSRSRCHNLDGHNMLLSTHLCYLLRNPLYPFLYTTQFQCSTYSFLVKILVQVEWVCTKNFYVDKNISLLY